MSAIQTEERLFEGAIEGARYFNMVAAECAATSGLFQATSEFSTVEEVVLRLRFHASKTPVVRALLNVLVDAGYLERRTQDGQTAYRTKKQAVQANRNLLGGLRRYAARKEKVEGWFNQMQLDMVRSYNLQLLGADLSFLRRPDIQMRFNNEYLGPWRFNLLSAPYEFGRMQAVRMLVDHGRRFLDLACGPGFGAERIAQYSPDGCEVVGVDRSADFLAEARKLVFPNARTRFIHRDLNTGLPPLPAGYFDGILFNGAFHFIKDKPARLREMHRVLRVGGLLVIGHCFSRSGFADEAMHDFYFSMIENECWPVSWESIRTMVVDAGFQELHQFHRGSHSYLFATRLEGTFGPPEEHRHLDATAPASPFDAPAPLIEIPTAASLSAPGLAPVPGPHRPGRKAHG
jgi:ubiquinone/menaquinone biosynthesis C-methylase UbiE